MNAAIKLKHRLTAKVNRDGPTLPHMDSPCHEWVAALDKSGYGLLTRNKRTRLAHQFIWENLNGPVPEGQRVCQRCRNRGCVNPDHLYIASQATHPSKPSAVWAAEALAAQKAAAALKRPIYRRNAAAAWRRRNNLAAHIAHIAHIAWKHHTVPSETP